MADFIAGDREGFEGGGSSVVVFPLAPKAEALTYFCAFMEVTETSMEVTFVSVVSVQVRILRWKSLQKGKYCYRTHRRGRKYSHHPPANPRMHPPIHPPIQTPTHPSSRSPTYQYTHPHTQAPDRPTIYSSTAVRVPFLCRSSHQPTHLRFATVRMTCIFVVCRHILSVAV